MNNVKRMGVLMLATMAGSGCVSSSPLVLLGIFPGDSMIPCAVTENSFVSSQEYSFSSAPAGTQVCLGVENLLASDIKTEVSSMTLDDPLTRNIVFVEEVLHSYSAVQITNNKSQSLSLPAETLREGFAVKPADKSGAFVTLLGDTAAQSLFDATAPGDKVDVLVTFRVRGRINSGGSITSQPFTWPARFNRQ